MSADELALAGWQGAYIVYHRQSGLTHVLNTAMFELLAGILKEPRDLDTAIGELSKLSLADANPPTREQMIDLLRRLEQLGLVRRE